ncbi:hypothetical protein LEMLEM_LOCUS10065 [Lemmus lemmus]
MFTEYSLLFHFLFHSNELEPKTSHMLGKHSLAELHSQLAFYFQSGSPNVAQVVLKSFCSAAWTLRFFCFSLPSRGEAVLSDLTSFLKLLVFNDSTHSKLKLGLSLMDSSLIIIQDIITMFSDKVTDVNIAYSKSRC